MKGLLIEFKNFDKYKLLIEQFGAGGSKAKKDLTEMRFISALKENLKIFEQ
jgi:hypothetical protein